MRAEHRVRIRHMIEGAESAARFLAGRQRQDLDEDEMLRFALTRAIEIIGEAAGRVSAETQNAAAQVPWKEVIGMRNRLVRAYFDVDLDNPVADGKQGCADLAGKAVSIRTPGEITHGHHQL